MTDEQKTQLYKEYSPKVLQYLRSKLQNSTLAEDLCADVFVKVYEKLDSFDAAKASLSTWIFFITRNTLTDYYRTRRVFGEVPEALAAEGSVEEALLRDEALDALADGLEKLETRQRDLILLHYYRGMTLKEVGQRMGLSYTYVKVLHKKALSALQKFL